MDLESKENSLIPIVFVKNDLLYIQYRYFFNNITYLIKLFSGDHIRVDRGLYHHHMLVIEVIDKYTVLVIHYSSPSGPEGKQLGGKNIILEEEISFEGIGIELVSYRDNVQLFKSGKAIANARSRLTEMDYSVFSNNCESFVNWALTGEDVTDVGNALATGAGVAVGVGVLGAVAYGLWSVFDDKKREK